MQFTLSLLVKSLFNCLPLWGHRHPPGNCRHSRSSQFVAGHLSRASLELLEALGLDVKRSQRLLESLGVISEALEAFLESPGVLLTPFLEPPAAVLAASWSLLERS